VPARSGLWAVLVAGSSGAEDRRHQVDVAAQHQLLRRNGVPEERIIVVTAGEVEAGPDYELARVTADDVASIVAGRRSTNTPDVVDAGTGDDVYVFIAGHGTRAGMAIGGAEELLTPAALRAAVEEQAPYRHLLLAVEACNAATFDVVAGAPRAAVLSAATADQLDYATPDGTADAFAAALAVAARDDDELVAAIGERVRADVPQSTVGLAGSNGDTSLPMRDDVRP
jgi:glycosylphosphatidylinositol transamidase (GPIT) subunit GPI8